MSMLLCGRRISETSPLCRSLLSVKGRTAFHLVADGHPFQEEGGRVDQRTASLGLSARLRGDKRVSRVLAPAAP